MPKAYRDFEEIPAVFGSDETMAKRSVTIRAALITGACAIVAAVILAVAQRYSARPPVVEKRPAAVGDDSGRGEIQNSLARPPVIEKSSALVGDGSGQDSNGPHAIDSQQPMASYVGSFDDYIGRLAALKDRNFERQEFLDSMVGQHVVWRGWVYSVSDLKAGTTVTITASREGPGIPPFMSVSFPASAWRTKLYALRNGDQVEVGAIYREGGSHAERPMLDGLSISIVEAK